MAAFKVFSGGLSPFDDAHKGARRFVVLREQSDNLDIIFATSKKRPDGAYLSESSQAFSGTGFTCAVTLLGDALVRVRKDSVWVRDAKLVGFLEPRKDSRFGEDFVRVLCAAQLAIFTATEIPLYAPMGHSYARHLEYNVIRFPL
ncbi:MAG: hypothetical protein ACYCSR_10260 [Thiomonas sp.]